MSWYLAEHSMELVKFYFIYHGGLHIGIRCKRYVYILDLLSVILVSYFMSLEEQTWNPMLPYLLFVIVTSLITYEGKHLKIVGITIWIALTVGLLDGISYTVVQIGFGILGIQNEKWEHLGASAVTIIFLLICTVVLNYRSYWALETVPIQYFVYFFVMLILNQIPLTLIWNQFEEKEFSLYGIFLLLSIGAFVQMILILLLASNNYLYRERQILNQKYLAAQEQHYQYLENKEKDTRKFRHDIRDHMHTICKMASQGKCDEIVAYMERIFGVLERSSNSIMVGNGIVDAILNRYADEFGKKEIEYHVNGHLPTDCFVEAFDLCTIFFNLLQNAGEAAERCEAGNREVTLDIRYEQQMIMIHEENTCCHKLNVKEGRLLTTKEDSQGHGYGVQNILESVRGYDGKVDYEQVDGRFMIYIILFAKR